MTTKKIQIEATMKLYQIEKKKDQLYQKFLQSYWKGVRAAQNMFSSYYKSGDYGKRAIDQIQQERKIASKEFIQCVNQTWDLRLQTVKDRPINKKVTWADQDCQGIVIDQQLLPTPSMQNGFRFYGTQQANFSQTSSRRPRDSKKTKKIKKNS